jgi:hypothetical protein
MQPRHSNHPSTPTIPVIDAGSPATDRSVSSVPNRCDGSSQAARPSVGHTEWGSRKSCSGHMVIDFGCTLHFVALRLRSIRSALLDVQDVAASLARLTVLHWQSPNWTQRFLMPTYSVLHQCSEPVWPVHSNNELRTASSVPIYIHENQSQTEQDIFKYLQHPILVQQFPSSTP